MADASEKSCEELSAEEERDGDSAPTGKGKVGYIDSIGKGKGDNGGKPAKGKGKGPGKPSATDSSVELTPEEKEFVRQFSMQKRTAVIKNKYTLSAHIEGRNKDSPPLGPELTRTGQYVFNEVSGRLVAIAEDGAAESECEVGVFSALGIHSEAFPLRFFENPGVLDMPCITVVTSDIIAEIQNPANSGAYFVLPSQLNGAEYPNHTSVVDSIDEYKFDNTAGPRAQLAVHPAAGQFMIDNAGNDRKPLGINAVVDVLQGTNALLSESGLTKNHARVANGYLKMPSPQDREAAEAILKSFQGQLHKLRPLVMEGVPACGLKPSKDAFATCSHAVNLVYASAVPINSYVNGIGAVSKTFGDEDQRTFQLRMAESVLVAQYYGGLKRAVCQRTGESKTNIFLMLLGGGAFKNTLESIARSISLAVEMLDAQERDALNIKVLAFDRGGEPFKITQLISSHRKLVGQDCPAEHT